jgi:hypothetical protein
MYDCDKQKNKPPHKLTEAEAHKMKKKLKSSSNMSRTELETELDELRKTQKEEDRDDRKPPKEPPPTVKLLLMSTPQQTVSSGLVAAMFAVGLMVNSTHTDQVSVRSPLVFARHPVTHISSGGAIHVQVSAAASIRENFSSTTGYYLSSDSTLTTWMDGWAHTMTIYDTGTYSDLQNTLEGMGTDYPLYIVSEGKYGPMSGFDGGTSTRSSSLKV